MTATTRQIFLFLLCLFFFFLTPTQAHLERHGPRDRFWRHHLTQKTLMVDGVDYYQPLQSCLDSNLTAAQWSAIQTDTAVGQRQIGDMYRDPYQDHWVFLVMIERAMTPSHVLAVQTLAACVRHVMPRSYEARSMSVEMGFDTDQGLGGNCPTHLAPLVELFFPSVAADMQRTLQLAYDAAGWKEFLPASPDASLVPYDTLPDPKDVGFRATEHLTYNDFKEGLKDHTDGLDTKYTFNYAFSDDYEGGEYYIKFGYRHKRRLTLKPKKYDAMIFIGGFYPHGVMPITSGVREMFSNELWPYPDAPFGSNLWSNTAGRMKKYLEYCNREQEQAGLEDKNAPCQVDFTRIPMRQDEYEEEYDEEEEEEEYEYYEEEEYEEEQQVEYIAATLSPQEDVTAPSVSMTSSSSSAEEQQEGDCTPDDNSNMASASDVVS